MSHRTPGSLAVFALLFAPAFLAATPVRVVPIPAALSVEEQELRPPSANLPRVAILIDERIEDSKRTERVNNLRVIEHELMADWTKRGFVFQQVETPAPSTDSGVAHIPDNVDVMIVGTALTRVEGGFGSSLMEPGGAQMLSCKASIGVRAFNVRTGEILASSDGSKTALHIDAWVCGYNALQRIAADASAELRKGVLARWPPRNSGPQSQGADTTTDP